MAHGILIITEVLYDMSVREGRYVSISIPNLYLPTALVSFLLLQQITRDKQL